MSTAVSGCQSTCQQNPTNVCIISNDMGSSSTFSGRSTEDLSLTSVKNLPSSKNIVMCLDGTNCEFGPKPFTNVLKFFRLLKKDDESQLCYYQRLWNLYLFIYQCRQYTDIVLAGIGTNPRVSSSLLASVDESCDAMVAFSMKSHILEAYKFLTRFYSDGDKIFLLGFRCVLELLWKK